MISRRLFQVGAGQKIGLDPLHQPMDAGVRLEGGLLGQRQHLVDRRQLCPQIGCGCVRGADDRCRFRGRVLVRLDRRSPRSVSSSSRSPVLPVVLPSTKASAAAETAWRCLAVDQPLQRLSVHLQGAQEGSDRRQEPLLQTDEGELRQRGLLRRQLGDAALAQLAIGREPTPEIELRRILGKARNPDGLDLALRECLAEATQIGLQPANHDRLEVLRARLDAAREALRIEHLEQRREAVGMAVVRRGGQEQAVLEALGQLAYRPRELAGDRVARPAGRRGVVRLVEDEQRARAKLAEHVAQARHVVLFGEQAVRDDEARAGGPRIDRKAAQAPQLARCARDR